MVQMRLLRKMIAVALPLVALLSMTTAAMAAYTPVHPAEVTDGESAPRQGLIDTITGRNSAAATSTAQAAAQATITATPAAIEVVVVTPTPSATLTPTLTSTPTTPSTATITPTTASGPANLVVADVQGVIEGTVIANRTGSTVQFFVEGQTWQLDALRSAGISLNRPTAVLNLFNCDTAQADQSECFWDPYLLQRDGFYEIVAGAEEGSLVNLVLRAAGAPPTDQIWIQNRSGQSEQVYFGAELRNLAPASVTEFSIDPETASVFYLRTCVVDANGEVCEWTATDAQPGTYYALVSESWQSGLPGATVTDLSLTPVLGASTANAGTAPAATANVTATEFSTQTTPSDAAAADAPAPVTAASATSGNITCTLAVPTLNVRSGPGLSFEVISKIMTTGDTPATVSVVARTESNEWLQVDARQANNGWIINGDAYLTCPMDTASLAVISDSELPATPTPLPIVESPSTSEPIASDPAASDEGGESAPAADAPASNAPESNAPAGLALLIVQNSFEQPIRFTLDQRYRVAEGPSEVDLAPGQSTSYVVYPGVVAFSASSAWRSLSGNAEILLEPDQEQPLYLIFIPDPGEEGKWIFQH